MQLSRKKEIKYGSETDYLGYSTNHSLAVSWFPQTWKAVYLSNTYEINDNQGGYSI